MTMSRVFRLAVLAVSVAAAPALSAQASTVILVRHAEKSAPTGDVDISDVGRARAQELKAALAGFPVQGIFVTQLKRTQQTAEPTATALGLTPTVVQVASDPAANAAATAAAIRQLPAGSAALVVGHSNTLGPIVAALGGPKLLDLCDGEFATLLVLELPATGPPRLLRASYGAPDPPTAHDCRHEQVR
jgi:broad specificity phosphatase PhoE